MQCSNRFKFFPIFPMKEELMKIFPFFLIMVFGVSSIHLSYVVGALIQSPFPSDRCSPMEEDPISLNILDWGRSIGNSFLFFNGEERIPHFFHWRLICNRKYNTKNPCLLNAWWLFSGKRKKLMAVLSSFYL